MNSQSLPFIHYSYFAIFKPSFAANRLILAWKPVCYTITKNIVTLCNCLRNKVSPPLWQSVSAVITIEKHSFFFAKKYYNHSKILQIMNSCTTIHRYYSFGKYLPFRVLHRIMNRWTLFWFFHDSILIICNDVVVQKKKRYYLVLSE